MILNFMRIDRIIPLLITIIIMFTLKNIKNYKLNIFFIILITISIIFQQISLTGKKFHSSIRANIKEDRFFKLKKLKEEKNILEIILFIVNKNNYKNNEYNLGNDKYSWDNYFHYNILDLIRNMLSCNSYQLI